MNRVYSSVIFPTTATIIIPIQKLGSKQVDKAQISTITRLQRQCLRKHDMTKGTKKVSFASFYSGNLILINPSDAKF